MPVTSVPDAAVHAPHQLMRNHQSAGPFAKFRSTDQSLFTVAIRAASATVNDDDAMW